MITRKEMLLAAAIANPNICTGTAKEYEINNWFGKERTCITKEEILLKQAEQFAYFCERMLK